MVFDAAGLALQYANPAAVSILRLSREQLQSEPHLRLARIHPDDRARISADFDNLCRQQREYSADYRLLTADGSFQIVCECGRIIPGDAAGGLLITIDAERAVEDTRRARRIQAQNEIIRALVTIARGESSVVAVLEALARNLEWDIAEFWQLDDSTRNFALSSLWLASDLPCRDEYERTSFALHITEDQAPLGKVWLGGSPQWTSDVRSTALPGRGHLVDQMALRTALWFPIAANGRCVGIVALYARAALPIDTELLQVIDSFSAELAGFLQQQRAIELLTASEQRFRQMFERNEAVKLVIDPVTADIVDANQAAVQFYGYPREHLLHMKITDINTLPLEQVRECIRLIEAEHKNHFDFSHRLASGEVRRVEVYSSPFESDGRRLLYSTIFDVTDSVRARQALHESEEHLRLIFQHTPAAIAIFDRQLRYLFTTKMWLERDPTITESPIGRLHYEVDPWVPERWREAHRRALDGEIVGCDEDCLTDADGNPVWCRWLVTPWHNSHGEIGGIIIFGEFLNERKQAADRIRESEEKYQRLFENMLDGLAYHKIILDDNGQPIDYVILEVNAAFERLTGLSREQIVGRRLGEVLPSTASAPDWVTRCSEIALHGGTQRLEHFVEELNCWICASMYTPLPGHFVTIFEDITQRKQAEAAAREAQRITSALLGNLPGMAYRCHNDRDWTMDYVNEGCFELTGYTVDELLGSQLISYNDLIHVDDREFVWTEVQKAIAADRRYRLTYRIVSRTGECKSVWEQGAALRNDRGDIVALEGFIADITDRVRAEEALQHREERFRALIESSTDIIMLFDARGLVTYISPSLQRILGYTPQEMVGRSVLDKIHRGDLRKFLRAAAEVLSRPRAEFSLELRVRHRDGSTRILEAVGRNLLDWPAVGAIVVNSRDITDRRLIEIERTQLATAVDQAVEGMIITDPDGRITYVNAAFERITGYSRDQAVEQPVRGFFTTFEGTKYFAEFWPQIQAGRTWSGRFRNQRANGESYDEELAVSPIRDVAGRIVNFVLVKRDISREVDLESRLRQAHKLEAVGRLASGIAHDFNNLLAGIRGFAELIVVETAADQRTKDYADEIVRAATRAADLTGQLLAFARKGNYLSVPVDLHNTIDEVARILRHTIDKRIILETDLQATIRTVKGDPSQIQSAILNLSVNARDAMPDGGHLTFRTANVHLDQDFCRRNSLDLGPGQYIALSVADTGIGIDETLLAHIFDPFFTTKEQGQGTGLGLAGVYGCARNHRGCVEVHSEVGKGSVFTMYLPAFETTEAPRPPQVLERATDGRERVLLVDDEQVVRNLAERILTRAGYKVFACENGEEAVAFYRAAFSSIDLVLLDMVMPRLNGLDALAELRKINPGVKAMILSGFSDHDGNALAQLGAAGFIPKPFQMQELLRAVREALDRDPIPQPESRPQPPR